MKDAVHSAHVKTSKRRYGENAKRYFTLIFLPQNFLFHLLQLSAPLTSTDEFMLRSTKIEHISHELYRVTPLNTIPKPGHEKSRESKFTIETVASI